MADSVDQSGQNVVAGDMAERVRTFDWSTTPLGPRDGWPDGLRTIVDVMLATPMIASLAVGRDRIFLYNDAAARLYGDRHPGALGRPMPQVFAHEFSAVADVYDRTFAGESVHIPSQPLDPARSGTNEVFDAYLTPVRDAGGAVIAAYMTGIAVTARLRAEERLRESEQRFRGLVEGYAQAVWESDADGLAVAASQSWQAATGQTDMEVLGAGWLDAVHPDDRDDAAATWRDAVARRGQFNAEFRLRLADGRWRWSHVHAVPVFDDQGTLRKWVGMNIDVDERCRAEAALRASEERLRTLVDGVPQLVWRADDRGDWTWASPQWTRFTGQSLDRSRDLGWVDAVHPDDREAVRSAWEVARAGGGLSVEHRLRQTGTGSYRWFQTRAMPVRDAGGAIVEWLGTSTDVDDLRQLQDRQRLLLSELQHRVRNILAVVRAVFSRTIAVEHSIDSIADHFRGRLDSLARTQVIVTQSAAGWVDLENLVREELLSVIVSDGPERIISGPEVALPADAVELFGLAIHELTTNALKYGALKGDGPRLEIRWHVVDSGDGRRYLHFEWTEHGVAAILVQPRRRGFWTELIEDALPYRLDARTSLEFRGNGIRCTIEMPIV